MTRTVADAAALLAVIAGPDPADPATADAAETARAAARAHPGSRGAGRRTPGCRAGRPDGDEKPDPHRIGLPRGRPWPRCAAAGAELVDVTLPTIGHDDELTVLHYEFGPGVDRYLAALGDGAPLRSLAEIQAWNRAHADVALKFGQVHVDTAVAVDHERDCDAYRQARDRDLRADHGRAARRARRRRSRRLVFPGAEGCGWAARAGWPSIVVPAGYAANNRRPVGIMLVSRPWTDARLLALAYAFEQAHPVAAAGQRINPAAFRRLALQSLASTRAAVEGQRGP